MNDQMRQAIIEIATEVYNQKGTSYGNADVPAHLHNGIDSSQIPPTSLTNVQTLSSQGTGVLNGITVSKMNPPIAVFPLPVLSAVPTGIAPDGTLVLTNISGTYGLYARVNSTWVYIGPDIGL